MTTREQIIAEAKEVGAYRFSNSDAKDEPTHTFAFEQLERFYNIAFAAGAASRDAEIQRLQMTLADAEALELGTAEKNDQLRAELVKALAACKVKDEALRELDQLIPVGATIAALAIQPDDAALKAWLGEPVSYLYKHASAFGYGEFWSHRQNHNGVTAIESKALYSPKLLK